MTGTASVVMACTAVADDNGMRALRDVAAVAADIEYRVIGGHMVRLLRHIYNVPGIPRLTSDADTGIDVDVAFTGDLHDRLTALGYIAECGNRYERGEQAVDLLVPPQAGGPTPQVGEYPQPAERTRHQLKPRNTGAPRAAWCWTDSAPTSGRFMELAGGTAPATSLNVM